MTNIKSIIAVLTTVATLSMVGGCSTTTYLDTRPDIVGPVAVSTEQNPEFVRILPIFTGNGDAIGWQDVLDACDWAEVIIIGEMHDDAIGHAVQLAVVRDVIAQHGNSTAVALEMLERDEQQLIDDYADGIITAKQFAKLTFSSKWAGEGSWESWYQPIIDAAVDTGSPVIAANAPRRYVRLGRLEGYDMMRAIPMPRRALFDIPTSLRTGNYRQRFIDLMLAMGRHEKPDDDASMSLSRREVEDRFRSQMVWDATMAQSVVNALREDSDRVILIIGQFHSDFHGGTVQEVQRRSPTTNVLTISMQQRSETIFNDEDYSRADIIIYTGDRPVVEEVIEEVEITESEFEFDIAEPTDGGESNAVPASQPQAPATQPHPHTTAPATQPSAE